MNYKILRLSVEQKDRYSKAIEQLKIQAKKWVVKVGRPEFKTDIKTKVILTQVGRYVGTVECPLHDCSVQIEVRYTRKNLWTGSNFLRHFNVCHTPKKNLRHAKKLKYTNCKTQLFNTNYDQFPATTSNGSNLKQIEEELKIVALKWLRAMGVKEKLHDIKVKVLVAPNSRYHGRLWCPVRNCGKSIAFTMSKGGSWNGSNYTRHFLLFHNQKPLKKSTKIQLTKDDEEQQVKLQLSLVRMVQQWLATYEQEEFQDSVKAEILKSETGFMGKILCPLPECEKPIMLTLYGKSWGNSSFKHHFETFHDSKKGSVTF